MSRAEVDLRPVGEGDEVAMAHTRTQPKVTPQQIADDLWGAWRTQTLIAGIELGLFSHIATGNRTVKEIARAAKASERGTSRLLNALVGLGYLKRKGERYGLEPVSQAFLVRGKQFYLGEMSQTTRFRWDSWAGLTDVVKRGRPIEMVDAEEQGRRYFPILVRGMFPRSFLAARTAVASLSGKLRKGITRILDVAAGSGAWSIAFAEAISNARVTVVDLPEVTPITRQFTESHGVADRFDYLEGNLREVEFDRAKYDLVILGHIIHSEGAKWGKRLIRKSYRALRENGLLLIADIIPNNRRTGPAFPLLFSLNMLLHTEQGDVFTMREYRGWLREIGFRRVTTIELPAYSPLILARR
jgi:ubiquinone/menaquinone biosynthesis C-methylase UbiE